MSSVRSGEGSAGTVTYGGKTGKGEGGGSPPKKKGMECSMVKMSM